MLPQHFTTHSAKTNLQDHARWCKNFACKTCLARARDMHDSCTILHIYLARNGKDFARDAARIIVPASLEFLAHFFARSALQELVQDCARIVQEKGHIACTCQASLACKILAQSCMILQVRFCWTCSYLAGYSPLMHATNACFIDACMCESDSYWCERITTLAGYIQSISLADSIAALSN